ncbi:hypothetical protein F5Y17DRAFT_453350 [Xylariaceae sp. FL0594]|nr:hypothetical protein F5Y17DRAFT_453350 [Xylariaceae sp. FL0594]
MFRLRYSYRPDKRSATILYVNKTIRLITMSKIPSFNATSTYLSKSKDFRTWDRELTQQAKSLMLWPYIRPQNRDTWPSEPVEPSMADYPKTANRIATRSSSTITVHTDQEEIYPNGIPRSAMEMTPSGRQQYNHDLHYYWNKQKAYERTFQL